MIEIPGFDESSTQIPTGADDCNVTLSTVPPKLYSRVNTGASLLITMTKPVQDDNDKPPNSPILPELLIMETIVEKNLQLKIIHLLMSILII